MESSVGYSRLDGHVETTLWGCRSTLAGRVVTEIGGSAAAGALPFAFQEQLLILRTKSVPAALHGIEASLISISGLASLRCAFVVSASKSSEMAMANEGTVLSLLDGHKPEEIRWIFSCWTVLTSGEAGSPWSRWHDRHSRREQQMQSLLLRLDLIRLQSSACTSERGRGSTRACGRHV